MTLRSRDVTRTVRAALGLVLLSLALVAIAYPLWWQHRSAAGGKHLLTALRPVTGKAATLGRCVIPPASAGIGVLTIPSLGLTAPVRNGMSNAVLAVAVGHDPATVIPGASGLAVVLAHDVSYFSGIDQLHPGNTIVFQAPCRASVVFIVTRAFVTAPGRPLSNPPATSGIALITCWPTNALFWTTQRYAVEAVRTNAPAPHHVPTTPAAVSFSTPAPPALRALGLSLQHNEVPMGTLTLTGSPTPELRQSPTLLAVEKAALQLYFGARKAALAHQSQWWADLAPGVPIQAPWPNSGPLNVTENARQGAITGGVVSSPQHRIAFRVAPVTGVLSVAP